MEANEKPQVRVKLTAEALAREVDDLQLLFDTRVLQSPVFIRAVGMSVQADAVFEQEGGGMIMFGDDNLHWGVGKGDSGKGMYRGLVKEDGEGMKGGAYLGRVNNPHSLELTYNESEESEDDSGTNTAAANIRALINEFATYSPVELKVFRPRIPRK